MDIVLIPITTLRPGAAAPAYQTPGAAGMDVTAAVDEPLVIPGGEHRLVPCGFAIAVPPGYEAQVRPRSGLAASHGVTVLNTPGTIDSDYRGEVKVILINHGLAPFTVTPAMRIAQLVVAPVARVTWDPMECLPDTSRGGGGFGHTGH
jgi:dUTP pyrophosphatase